MNYVLTAYQLNKKLHLLSLYLFLCIPFNPLQALEYGNYLLINKLVMSCYKDIDSCNSALIKLHYHQKNAAIYKKFSCQTRLLGLEANLIMAMNSNFKKKDAKRIIQAVKKYC